MSEGDNTVVYVSKWFENQNDNDKTRDMESKLKSLDSYIRSKISPPVIGAVVFAFDGGKVSLTSTSTRIDSDQAEILIRSSEVMIRGSKLVAYEVFCAIHRVMEDIHSIIAVSQ